MNKETKNERDLIDYVGKCETKQRRNRKWGYKKRKGGKSGRYEKTRQTL